MSGKTVKVDFTVHHHQAKPPRAWSALWVSASSAVLCLSVFGALMESGVEPVRAIAVAAIASISVALCLSIAIAGIGLVLIGRTVSTIQLVRELRESEGIAVKVRIVTELEEPEEGAPEDSDTIKGNNYH